jgi:hypothetical protein
MTVSDLGLALTAFIGITGYLPFTVIGAINTSVAVIYEAHLGCDGMAVPKT